jgi:hypothetical protein
MNKTTIDLIIIFTLAFIIRFSAWAAFNAAYDIPVEFPSFDSHEYYHNSENLEVWKPATEKLGYTQWTDRTPAYTLYLYLTNQNLWIQLLISCLTVVLMYMIHPVAGMILCFYPVHIIYSFQYMKETLLLYFVVYILYTYRNAFLKWVFILLIMLPFVSYGPVSQFNANINPGFMTNVWNIWKPDFPNVTYYGLWWNYVLMIPYLFYLVYFIRHSKIFCLENILAFTFTMVYSFIYGNARFREPVVMAIIAWYGKPNKEAQNHWENY